MQKARVIRRVALAPANPSPKDRSIAAKAARMEREATQGLAEAATEKQPEAKGSYPENRSSLTPGVIPPNPKETSRAYRQNAPSPSGAIDPSHMGVATLKLAM